MSEGEQNPNRLATLDLMRLRYFRTWAECVGWLSLAMIARYFLNRTALDFPFPETELGIVANAAIVLPMPYISHLAFGAAIGCLIGRRLIFAVFAAMALSTVELAY